ncbi:MAG: riboflavin synthase [Planctomycetota bacterium]|nr:MAG: riboflavin synthase [Planctomycetota bacterium]
MFTGLIETVCPVKLVRRSNGAMHLAIDLGKLADESKVGDSIAINGVCLTVAKLEAELVTFEVSAETLTRSTLGRLQPASGVNVELSMKASGRFGGHIVQGHIDGVGTIKAIERQGEFVNMKLAAGAELLENMVVKGSVAVDGISLTIASMDESSFRVAIIPQTLKRTTLGKAKVGDIVNIETDIIAKIIKKQLDKILPTEGKLTVERLKELGF